MFDLDKPLNTWAKADLDLLLHAEKTALKDHEANKYFNQTWEGIVAGIKRRSSGREDETIGSPGVEMQYFRWVPCPECRGSRLSPLAAFTGKKDAIGNGRLGAFLVHPELVRNYPWIVNIDVEIRYEPSKGAGHHGGEVVSYSDGSFGMRVEGGSLAQLRKTMSHELHHVIAAYEGLAEGGTPREFEEAKRRAKSGDVGALTIRGAQLTERETNAQRYYNRLTGERQASSGGVLGPKDFPEINLVGRKGTVCSPAAEDFPEDLPGLGAAQAHNADPPSPQGGGDRGNRVPMVHEDFFSGLMMTLR